MGGRTTDIVGDIAGRSRRRSGHDGGIESTQMTRKRVDGREGTKTTTSIRAVGGIATTVIEIGHVRGRLTGRRKDGMRRVRDDSLQTTRTRQETIGDSDIPVLQTNLGKSRDKALPTSIADPPHPPPPTPTLSKL